MYDIYEIKIIFNSILEFSIIRLLTLFLRQIIDQLRQVIYTILRQHDTFGTLFQINRRLGFLGETQKTPFLQPCLLSNTVAAKEGSIEMLSAHYTNFTFLYFTMSFVVVRNSLYVISCDKEAYSGRTLLVKLTEYKQSYQNLVWQAECQRYTNRYEGAGQSRNEIYHLLFCVEIQFEGQVHFHERVELRGIDLSHPEGQLPVHPVVEIFHRCAMGEQAI